MTETKDQLVMFADRLLALKVAAALLAHEAACRLSDDTQFPKMKLTYAHEELTALIHEIETSQIILSSDPLEPDAFDEAAATLRTAQHDADAQHDSTHEYSDFARARHLKRALDWLLRNRARVTGRDTQDG